MIKHFGPERTRPLNEAEQIAYAAEGHTIPEVRVPRDPKPSQGDRHARMLIQQGVEWAVAEDRAFLNGIPALESWAAWSKNAAIKALAEYLAIDVAEAEAIILNASDN